ncbi:DUF2550 family protein [Actinomyces oricola]|uniref:DUF2550 family protein n=1 Tax=Actinomyces oricola TaxID=206043 RepID=UPI000FFE59C3|nr:DUF2550 family protein [Actinomyces oricola]
MPGSGWWIVVFGVVLVLVAAGIVFLVRLRVLAGRLGSFECALREAGRSRWTSGVAEFGSDSLQWYRLVSLSPWPKHVWSRIALEVGQATRRSERGRVMEVTCQIGETSFELAMLEESHSALVSWAESAAPTQSSLF